MINWLDRADAVPESWWTTPSRSFLSSMTSAAAGSLRSGCSCIRPGRVARSGSSPATTRFSTCSRHRHARRGRADAARRRERRLRRGRHALVGRGRRDARARLGARPRPGARAAPHASSTWPPSGGRARRLRGSSLGATPAVGCASVTQFVGYVPPGRAPDHFHRYDEVIYVLEGEGTLHIAGEEAPLHPGACVHLPATSSTASRTTGDGEMHAARRVPARRLAGRGLLP